jgi:hypothetical protein
VFVYVITINNQKISVSSFYPGRGDNTHPLAHLDHGNYTFHTPEVDNDGSVTDDDSIDDGHTAELAL